MKILAVYLVSGLISLGVGLIAAQCFAKIVTYLGLVI
jgi:hypothetical protein